MNSKLVFISNTVKNFLAFGNSKTELILDKHPLTSIVAQNGSGKTAIAIDAIFFGLFGETYRDLKKDQIINSVNMKDCLVETKLLFNGRDEVEIIRGISPDVFNVFINGDSMWDDLNKVGRQKALEKYLNITKKTIANQVLISETSEPFMKMDGPTRKEFVEKMLNIEVFDDIHRQVKEEVKSLKPKVAEKEIELRSKREMQDRLLSVRKEQASGYDPLEVQALQERIAKGEKVVANYRSDAEEAKSDYDSAKENLSSIEQICTRIKWEINSLQNDIDKRNSSDGVCSACGQPLPDGEDHSHDEEERLEKLKDELETHDLENLQIAFGIKKDEAQAIVDRYKNAVEKLDGLKSDLADMERKKPSETIDDQILEVTTEYDDLMASKEALDEEYADLLDIDKVLKSGVAKAPLISEYIPFFNLQVNKYLEMLGLPILLELDSSFKESVRSRFRQNFTYDSFSTGQQSRINFAIMMTWRDVSQKLSSVSSNLLIIDEFGSKLDDEGVEAVAKVLSELEGTNTICIGPRELIGEYDRKLKIKTVSNFAVME